MRVDSRAIARIFEKAEEEGRNFLLEHEVYALLRKLGIQTPRFHLLLKGEKVDREILAVFSGESVVLKIVSPLIIHKTEVGGVQFVKKDVAGVNRAVREMLDEVPRKYREWSRSKAVHIKEKKLTLHEMKESIKGILVLEHVDYEKTGFGEELLIGLRNSREFGPVVTMDVGGVDVEYLNERMTEGRATAIGSAHLLGKKSIPSLLQPLVFFDKIVKEFRGRKPLLSVKELAETYSRFLELGEAFSPLRDDSPFVIEEAEVNPFVVRRGKLIPLDGMCRFSRMKHKEVLRPSEDIDRLLHPHTIGIIGVSEKMNIGRIILNNILREGFPREHVFVVKPGLESIDGCRCVPSVRDIPGTVDLFVLTLSAGQSFEVMKEIFANENARSVILIAGGIGEKKGTEALEDAVRGLIRKSREEGRLTPVVNGGNCLGIYSRPGRYDTTFIPEYKLTKPVGKNPRVVYISQSGAFMISRMSKTPGIEPLYAISLGNQIDLTASDYLSYFNDHMSEVQLFALYIEGFQPLDGLILAKAAGELVRKGKKVIVYKAGRSAEGRTATSSHTASVAGDYPVCRAVLEAEGVIVAEDIFEFESSVKNLFFLEGKKAKGNRVGLISNAGFECVIMADNLKNGHTLRLASFSLQTKRRIADTLAQLGIDRLQDIQNPLDVTPVADDEVFARCVEAILEDEGVDCAVVSPVPMTTAMQTLPPGKSHQENITMPLSIGKRLAKIFRKSANPFVVNIDAGFLYDPLVNMLEKEGVPTFRRSDDAVRFLRKFCSLRFQG